MSAPKLTQLGRYQVGEELGRGGMGVVYKGHDPRLGRDVALKTIRADALTSPGQSQELVTRLRREAGAAARLSHPNVVTIFDIDEADGYVFVAMELMKGTPLDELLARRTAPDLRQVAYLLPICEALEHLHTHGIIHRDLKPANIMVLPDGLVKLMDFGIAKDLMSQDITQTGAVMGTPVYMAPEQFMGQPIDARTDLFAAGVILFDICCMSRPFPGNTPMAIMQQIMNGKPEMPGELNPDIPDALEAVILKSLAKERGERFQSAHEMAEAIEDALAEMSTGEVSDASRRGLGPRRTRAIAEADDSTYAEPAAVAPAAAPDARTTPRAEPELEDMSTLPPPPTGGATYTPAARPSTPPKTGGSRTPLLIGVGVAVALAVGVGGVLALRASKVTPAPAEAPLPTAPMPTDPVTTPPPAADAPFFFEIRGEQWIGEKLRCLEPEAEWTIPSHGRVYVPRDCQAIELASRCRQFVTDIAITPDQGSIVIDQPGIAVPNPGCE